MQVIDNPRFYIRAVLASENTYYFAQNGPASQVAGPAASFSLVDQSGSSYVLGEHPGHYTCSPSSIRSAGLTARSWPTNY